jgi:hypothetical protein
VPEREVQELRPGVRFVPDPGAKNKQGFASPLLRIRRIV